MVFVKEIVPRFAIATVARVFYGEPYETWTMSHAETENRLSYFWRKATCENHITARIGESAGVPPDDSHGAFIVEHYWGYTSRGASRTDEYKVEHPKWEIFAVEDSEIAVDFGRIYGERFAFLSEAKPHSILLAKGSPVAVYKGAKLIL